MGLNINDIKFLLWAKQEGVDFTKMMMIGRQKLYLNVSLMDAAFSAFGIKKSKAELAVFFSSQDGYAEPFLRFLGAKEIESIDASVYESATHVVDMNQPIKEDLKEQFSVVFDGGSLEHVFNFPTAIRNCMEMIRQNGHFIAITPCNNYMGHGFYQFSPELFFRIFTEQNGFKMEKAIVYENSTVATWYEVSDPEAIRKRAQAQTRRHTLLIVLARRTAIKPLFTTPPQQSDYAAIWHQQAATGQHKTISRPLSMAARIDMELPLPLKKAFRRLAKWMQPKMDSDAFQEFQIPKPK
jgi:hypothetical protein